MIERGDCANALPCLAVALQAAKASFHEDAETLNEEEETFNLDALISTTALCDSFGDEEYTIFDQPIRIPEPSSKNLHPTTLVCSAISIFNLALAYHLQARTSRTQNRFFLKKSEKLYEFVLQILESSLLEGSIPSNTLFCLAILNNLSDVHRCLGEVTTSQQYCEDILRMLMHISGSRTLSMNALDAFYRNSFFYLMTSRGVHVAPAA